MDKNKLILPITILLGCIVLGGFYYAYTNSKKCNIKGNISGDKIYHLPGCASYDKTTIDESKGERWFCSEKEAIDAGWRKAKNCGK